MEYSTPSYKNNNNNNNKLDPSVVFINKQLCARKVEHNKSKLSKEMREKPLINYLENMI